MGVIYKITSPSNKVYVGKTYDLSKRIAAHKCATKYGKNILLYNSIRKYGWDAHVLEVIEEISDELMNEREMFWIVELNTYCYESKMGLNMTKGGDGQRSTWMHKTELRKFFSDKFSGEGNPFHGKTHSDETKRIIAQKASKRNKERGTTVPEWGAEKGRGIVMRPIVCYDLNGDFVKEFKSVTEAGTFFNVKNCTNICRSCNGEQSNCGGYIFRYKSEGYPLKIEVVEVRYKAIKRPVLTLSPDYEIVCEHPSAQEASEFWGIPKTTINRAAMYNWLVPIRTGHVFIYTDLYEEILKAAS